MNTMNQIKIKLDRRNELTKVLENNKRNIENLETSYKLACTNLKETYKDKYESKLLDETQAHYLIMREKLELEKLTIEQEAELKEIKSQISNLINNYK